MNMGIFTKFAGRINELAVSGVKKVGGAKPAGKLAPSTSPVSPPPKFATMTNKAAGQVAIGGAKLGVTGLGVGYGGVRLYDYFKKTSAMSDATRDQAAQLDNYERALDLQRQAQSQGIPIISFPGSVPQDAMSMPGYMPNYPGSGSPSSSGGMSPLFIIGALALVGGGIYLARKKKK